MISVQLQRYHSGEVLAMAWPIPEINDDNRAFWTGGETGRLMTTRCEECGFRTHPPVPRCPSCYSERVAPSPVSGRGRVYSYTINRQRWNPDLEVPYVIAIVELDEQPGLRLLTNIVGTPVDEVAIDMPVEVEFVHRGDAYLPVFHPVRVTT
jgi:uncharacterized OB-fold protein